MNFLNIVIKSLFIGANLEINKTDSNQIAQSYLDLVHAKFYLYSGTIPGNLYWCVSTVKEWQTIAGSAIRKEQHKMTAVFF